MTFLSLIARSHPHAAVDGKPGAGDEPGTVGGEEHYRVRDVRYLAKPAERGQPDDRARRLLRAWEQADGGAVHRELVAHLGGDKTGVDAVHPDAVAEPA